MMMFGDDGIVGVGFYIFVGILFVILKVYFSSLQVLFQIIFFIEVVLGVLLSLVVIVGVGYNDGSLGIMFVFLFVDSRGVGFEGEL